MENQDKNLIDNENDIELSRPKASRFLFLLGFFGIFIFAWAGCYNLHQHKYVSNPVKYDDGNTYGGDASSASADGSSSASN